MLAGWLAVSATAWFVLNTVVMRSYMKLEEQAAAKDVERSLAALISRGRMVDAMASDWAAWDDAWRFVQGQQPEFAEDNITPVPFEKVQLNLLMFSNLSGEVVHATGYDLDKHSILSPPAAVLSQLLAEPRLFDPGTGGQNGVLRVDDALMLVAARPVVRGDGNGPVAGTVIFGRWLDAAEVARAAETAGVDFSLVDYDEARKEGWDGERTPVRKDRAQLVAFAELSDLRGERAAIVRVVEAREVFGQGLRTMRAVFLAFVVSSGLFAVLMTVLIDQLLATHRAQAESERLRGAVLDAAAEMILIAQPGTLRVLQANPAAAAVLGSELVGGDAARLLGFERPALEGALVNLPVGERRELGEVEVRSDDDTSWFELSVRKVLAGEGEVLVLMARDVTEARAVEGRMLFAARHDALTGLPNRAYFRERLDDELADMPLDGGLAVLFLDLDGFKEVNDGLGHDVADRLLTEVGGRLRGCARQGDVVARQGGDEFLVLMPNVRSPDTAAEMARILLEALHIPFTLQGREVRVGGSIGIALAPTDGTDAPTLIRHADLAMYKAKELNRGAWQLFDSREHPVASRLLSLRNDLAAALENEEFVVHYQPQVHAITGEIHGVEALVRWYSPTGPVSPADFVPFAEETGLIAPIGDWVLRRACLDAMRWIESGLPPIRVSVNLSPRQFLNDDIVSTVREALDRSGLPPSRLELEITESLAMRDPRAARVALDQLRAVGVGVAIDDFGTGHSSLANLRLYPLDRLKIDRSFVLAATEPNVSTLVAAMIGLGHALRLEVVAEGVETAEQLKMLREHHCDLLQGYLVAPPMTSDELVALYAMGKPVLGGA